MFNKTVSIIAALAISMSLAHNAFAAFDNFHLIRVVSDKTGGSTLEIATDLGDVRTLAGLTNTTIGGGGDAFTNLNPNPLANLSVNYYAVNRTTVLNGTMYIGANTVTTPTTPGVAQIQNKLSNTIPATSPISVNKYYASQALASGSTSSVIGNNTAAGSLGAMFGSTNLGAYAGYTGLWASNANLSLANLATTPVAMTVWQFGPETGINMASPLTGVKVLTLTTNADGSTTINPTFTVTAIAGSNGSLDAGTQSPANVVMGSTKSFSFNAANGFFVSSITGCNGTDFTNSDASIVIRSYTTGAVTGNCTVTASFTAGAAKSNQTIGAIGFTPATLTAGGTATVSATATSGLAVNFSSTTPAVCTVFGATVTGVSAGTCTIAADQPGDSSHNAAPQVTQNITVGPAPSVRIDSDLTPYYAIGVALASPISNATIRAQSTPNFVENIIMANPVTILLKGGYTDSNFINQSDYTTIKGSLKIRGGVLKVQRLKIQ